MKALLVTLLSLSLGGSLLGALLLLLQHVMKRRLPASFAYYAWLLVLLRFVLPLPGLLPLAEAAPAQSAPLPVVTAYPVAQASAPGVAPLREAERQGANVRTAAPALPAAEPAAQTAPAFDFGRLRAAVHARLTDWEFWGFVWLAGAVLGLLWYTAGYLRFRRLLRRSFHPADAREEALLRSLGADERPALRRSPLVRTPILLGLLRPVIVLPERDYDEGMLRGILQHELTHYRRGDIAYKWFAALVSCLHWFNPLLPLFRRRIDRSCELSCDERLLRRMDREEKHRYGELLLALAADRPLPRRVVAMSFATEKRNLKERLVQIMKFKNTGRAGLALALAAMLLLSGCGAVLGPNTANAAQAVSDEAIPGVVVTAYPAPTPEAAEEIELYGENIPEERIEVGSVDELIAAIGSDRVIRLADGEYNLTEAASYGGNTGNDCVSWLDSYDGYELVISGVQNLYLVGGGADKVSIVTEPRYANVLHFDWGRNVNLIGFTAGHTEEPGYCSGGVLYFSNCSSMSVTGCDLYGCGTIGISAFNCRGVRAVGTEIRECSYGAIEAYNSFDLRFESGRIHDCGQKGDFTAYDLFSCQSSTGFAVLNTEICGNKAQTLLHSAYSPEVLIRGCSVHDNEFGHTEIYNNEGGAPNAFFNGGVFHITGQSPVIADCSFTDNVWDGAGMYYNYEGENPGFVTDAESGRLELEDLEAMEQKDWLEPYYGPHQVEALPPAGEVNEAGETVYHVDNVDDFLAAIGSDTTIYVDTALLDFSEAGSYGGFGSVYYYWTDTFDGPSLVITGVDNLHIIGMGKGQTTLQAVPRYADVLCFNGCTNISVEALTAGHLKEEPGSCVGDVLEFSNCKQVLVRSCGLFGCGVNAIVADGCRELSVEDVEMYECSNQGAQLFNCFGVSFYDCSIHDCLYNSVYVHNCSNATWNGKVLRAGNNNLA